MARTIEYRGPRFQKDKYARTFDIEIELPVGVFPNQIKFITNPKLKQNLYQLKSGMCKDHPELYVGEDTRIHVIYDGEEIYYDEDE